MSTPGRRSTDSSVFPLVPPQDLARHLGHELSAEGALRSSELLSRPLKGAGGQLRSSWLLYFAAVLQGSTQPLGMVVPGLLEGEPLDDSGARIARSLPMLLAYRLVYGGGARIEPWRRGPPVGEHAREGQRSRASRVGDETG